MSVKKIKFKNRTISNLNFEINTLNNFFGSRPKAIFETDFRTDFWFLMYIIEGEGHHIVDFKDHHYHSGDLLVVAKDTVQSFRVNYDVRGYIVIINEPFFYESGDNIDMEMMAFFETPIGKPIINLNMKEDETSRILIDLIYREYQEKNENGYKLIKSLFQSFVFAIRSENEDLINEYSPSLYQHYYDYRSLVNKNYNSLKTVDEYSSILGLSKKTINKACRACGDVSAKTLIVNRVILEAKRLIVQDKLKMYEISDELGFDEPANFAGFFKRFTGMSVKSFKQTQKKSTNSNMFG